MFQSFDETAATAEVAGRVRALRALLQSTGLAAFLVPRGDEHRGEYVAPSSERLKWLTAFSGSAGAAVVGHAKAALFVDGRYTVQAPQQTDTTVFEVHQTPTTTPTEWLKNHLSSGDSVGYDPWLHSIDEIERLTLELKPLGITAKPTTRNPIDQIWGDARPVAPTEPVHVQPVSRAGRSATDKVKEIQQAIAADGQDAVVLTMPDSICWLLNIRGSDIPHTPVVLAFAIVPQRGKPELFIEKTRVGAAGLAHLKPIANIVNPAKLRERLLKLKSSGKRVRLSKTQAAQWFRRQLGDRAIAFGVDPCFTPKAIKNNAEIKGARAAHARDAVAMCRFLAWFDKAAAKGGLDEITAAQKLESFRHATGKLREISFDTIAGAGPNGAIVHYRVNVESNRQIRKGELFLLDSGAQYADGTTDITRTIAVGAPTRTMRRHYTLVLKGHIAIADAIFPEGSRGLDLDPLARQALWREGLDFDHGTGHGVGSYLSVHEGPQSISRRGDVVLQPGMVISNEPGFYKEGAYGIRIENLVLVNPPASFKGGDRAMLSFETLTFAPFDQRLIDLELLDLRERAWIDRYHAEVAVAVREHLNPDERTWLDQATKSLS